MHNKGMTVNAMAIYSMRPSFEEDRPDIDFEHPDNGGADWDMVNEVIDGEIRVAAYSPFHLTVDSPDATAWDFYSIPGTMDLMSQRAVELLSPVASKHFAFLEVALNEQPYFLLMSTAPLDCLDRTGSKFTPFRSDSSRIKEFERFSFKYALIDDPVMFWIPEWREIFVTPSVRDMVQAAELRGFFFEERVGERDRRGKLDFPRSDSARGTE